VCLVVSVVQENPCESMKSVSEKPLSVDSLAEAGDCRAGLAIVCSGLTYTTGGADDWVVDYGESYQGHYSARSGYIDDGQESYLQTEVTGSGTIKFWWKVSSEEGCDYLEFRIDDMLQNGRISGSVDWEQKSYPVSGTGPHTLKWRYVKDGNDANDNDCGWVDWVQWSGSCPPAPEPDPTAWLTLAYRYDAAGRRVEKKYGNNIITKYVYDGAHCLAEYDVSNNLRRKYIYGPGVDQPIALIESAGSYAGTYYYHCDGLGSVVALTDDEGDTVQVYEYDVYGRVGATDANHPNRILFTGREYDKETGLYYYRARYYNPQIGRFLQTDPIGYGAGINWYRYCRNNPLVLADPSGTIDMVGYFPQPRITTPQPQTIDLITALALISQYCYGGGGTLTITDAAFSDPLNSILRQDIERHFEDESQLYLDKAKDYWASEDVDIFCYFMVSYPVKNSFGVTYGNGSGFLSSLTNGNFKYYLIYGATFEYEGWVDVSRAWNETREAWQYSVEWRIQSKITDKADFHAMRGVHELLKDPLALKNWFAALGYILTDGVQQQLAALLTEGNARPYDIEIQVMSTSAYPITRNYGASDGSNGLHIPWW
jgi:RHS repeat-associated protein